MDCSFAARTIGTALKVIINTARKFLVGSALWHFPETMDGLVWHISGSCLRLTLLSLRTRKLGCSTVSSASEYVVGHSRQ